GHLEVVPRLGERAVAAVDLEDDAILGVADRELRLVQRPRLGRDLARTPPPVERLPLDLHADGGEVLRQDVDVQVRSLRGGEADVSDAFAALRLAIELGLLQPGAGLTQIRTRLERAHGRGVDVDLEERYRRRARDVERRSHVAAEKLVELLLLAGKGIGPR